MFLRDVCLRWVLQKSSIQSAIDRCAPSGDAREDHALAACRTRDLLEEERQPGYRVQVGGPVQGQDEVLAALEALGITERRGAQAVEVREQRVDHRIADEVHLLRAPSRIRS
jgi:hypothetical protein